MEWNKKILLSIILSVFLISIVSAYDWNFSTPSDYIYNQTEIIVSGGNAYLNGTISTPYSWLHFNENIGTTVGDSSGNDRNGTIIANATWVTGKLNSALRFNGATQFVNFTNSSIGNFERTEAHSYEFWVKSSTTPSTYGVILSKYDATSIRGFNIYIDNLPNVVLLLATSGTSYLLARVSATPILDGNWHHIIVTYDGSSSSTGVRMYYDGVNQSLTVPKDNLAGTILTTENFKMGRDSLGNYFTGDLDEIVIYNKVLSQSQVSFRYNSGSGTENPLPTYNTGNFTIQPINNFTFLSTLNIFNETAIKTGSEIRYSVTSNGTWKYWNGTSWTNSDGSWSQSNSASDINAHINTLASSGNFSFKAILHSTDGTYSPYLDNIYADECVEDWVNYNTTCGYHCGSWDKLLTYYLDSNTCGTNNSLPVNNGTCLSCDYCSPLWVCNLFNQSCGDVPPQPSFIYCTNVTTTNYATCCAITGLPSDCSGYLGDYSEFTQICGNITVLMQVNSYPYVDLNSVYPINLYLLQNGVSVNYTDFFMQVTNSSNIFNFTWNNATQRYELSLLFSTAGNYPFIIYAKYPYDRISNITGTFKVYEPYYLTVKLVDDVNFDPLNVKYAQILAEPTNINFTNEFVESFMYPLTYIKNPVFHANYTTDRAVIKLYENGNYRIRILTGNIKFNSTFSEPEIIDSYGINSYLGTVTTNGTNQTVTYAVGDKQLRQYFWIFNWILIIAIVFSIIIGVFLLFIVPQQPLLSLIFSFTMVISLCILRIVVWIYFQ